MNRSSLAGRYSGSWVPRPAYFVAVLATTIVTACTNSTPADSGFTVRDSAGVQIVSSARPAWDFARAWTVSDAPIQVIGSGTGDAAHSLYRVTGAARFSDGRIAIANSGTSQIRIYDPNGVHLQSIGARGGGPGEFQSLQLLRLTEDDSLMAFDRSLSRVTILDSNGVLARTVRVPPDGGATQAFAMHPFSDGSLLVAWIVRGDAQRVGLFKRGSRVFMRYSPDGRPMNRIAEIDMGLNWGYELAGALAYSRAPFELVSSASVGDGSWLYLGSGREFEFRNYSADGRAVRITRWSGRKREVTRDDVDAYEEFYRSADVPEFPNYADAKLEGMVFPEHMPTYQDLLVDDSGNVWVEQFRASWEHQRRWWVFDRNGAWLGEPSVPPDLDIRHVGTDFILGIRRDETDVEQVALYGLER